MVVGHLLDWIDVILNDHMVKSFYVMSPWIQTVVCSLLLFLFVRVKIWTVEVGFYSSCMTTLVSMRKKLLTI